MEFQWLGPYQVVRKLGRGGMGVVYEGVDVETGQRAALKVLSAALSEEQDFRNRFEAEIETLRRLKHPNIVRLFGFGQQEGLLFYAMELVDGPSLDTELRRGRKFLWPEVVQIGLQICRGLRHAHDRGVIHRDLKPGNLLWASDGTVKLADFGIAQLFGRTRITAVGSVVGTLDYMAPEQAEGGLVDARADLYSLGAVLYALLSGRPPLRAKTLSEMLEKLHNTRPSPIRHYAPDAPATLEQLLDQLLEKAPERRISSAQIAGRRLEALLQEEAVPEGPPQAGQVFKEGGTPSGKNLPLPEDPPKAVEEEAGDLGTEPWLADQPKAKEDRAPSAEKEVSELPETKSMTWPVGPGIAGVPVSQASEAAISQGTGEKEGGVFSGAKASGSASLPSSQADQEASSLLAPTRQATPPELWQVKPIVVKEESASEVGEMGAAYQPESTRRVTDSLRPTHFTSISEEELDQMPLEEPHRPWVSWQTWVLAAALLAVGGTVWYLLQPPSADALYERILRTADEGTIEALRAAEPTIQEFLTRYSSDPRAEQIRQYERELDLDRLERRFELQASGRLRIHTALSPVEQAYAEAAAAARTNPDLAVVKLQALLDLYENRSDRSGPTGACLELARRRLQRLRQEVEHRAAGGLQVLQERLHRAEQLEKTSPETARAIRQAIVELYANKPWAAPAVTQAKAALAAPIQSSPSSPKTKPSGKEDTPESEADSSKSSPSPPKADLPK